MLETLMFYGTIILTLLTIIVVMIIWEMQKNAEMEHEYDLLEAGYVRTPIKVDVDGGYIVQWEWRKQFSNLDKGGQQA